jgi:PhzF family phenazine biosynthesis protein
MELDYKQVDVFTSTPFQGNPVAVVFNADNLSSDKMQRIANWTNLSETTFVQSSGFGDYRLRIFTPKSELAFAGHPTIGSAFAVLQSGRLPPGKKEFFQECKAGLVRLIIDDDLIFAQVPNVKILDHKLPTSEFEDAIGCQIVTEPIAIDSGPIWAVSSVSSKSMQKRLSNLARNII